MRKKVPSFSDAELISMIQSHDELLMSKAMRFLYSQHYRSIQASMRRFQPAEEAYKDVFHQGTIALYELICRDKINLQKGTLGGLLHAIIRRLFLKNIRDHEAKRLESLEDERYSQLTDGFWDGLEQDEVNQDLLAKINRLNPKCRQTLKLYYYLHFSMEAIALNMELGSENAAKMAKSRCLKKLRSFFT